MQPFIMASIGGPLNLNPAFPSQIAGAHNAYYRTGRSTGSWNDGFAIKTGLGIYVQDGTVQGPTGLSNVGNPWWTFQPELAISYLANGWNLTAFLYEEFNTKNSVDGYTTGDIFHADFTATKTIGKWTRGCRSPTTSVRFPTTRARSAPSVALLLLLLLAATGGCPAVQHLGGWWPRRV